MYQMKKNDSSSWSNQFDNLSSQKQIATNLLIEWYDKARPTQLVEDSTDFPCSHAEEDDSGLDQSIAHQLLNDLYPPLFLFLIPI